MYEEDRQKRYSKLFSMMLIRYLDTAVIINEEGNIVQEYRKVHLFDVDLTHKGGVSINESSFLIPGNKIPEPIFSPIGYVGPSIVSQIKF